MPILKIRTAADLADANYSLGRMLDTPGGFEKLAVEKLPPYIRELIITYAMGFPNNLIWIVLL